MPALVYHTGALGDFITTIPALRFWKTRHKNERLVLLGNTSMGAFAKDIKVVDDYLDVNSPKAFLPLFFEELSPEIDRILSPFQTAILFAAPDSPVIGNIRQSDILSLHWQPPFPATADKIHITDYHLSLFIDPQLLDPEARRPHITPSAASIKESFTVIHDRCFPVALHPGSGSGKKNWPFERYQSLADAVRKKGVPVAWFIGPADDAFSVPSEDLIVLNQPLALCAALLSRCRAFIGNDSGIAHLAASVGCRTVALFGPSDPMVWSPRGRDVRVIYKNLPCSPCHRSPAAPPSCDNGCLTAITVEEVLEAI